jgi:hypothetical protein
MIKPVEIRISGDLLLKQSPPANYLTLKDSFDDYICISLPEARLLIPLLQKFVETGKL